MVVIQTLDAKYRNLIADMSHLTAKLPSLYITSLFLSELVELFGKHNHCYSATNLLACVTRGIKRL